MTRKIIVTNTEYPTGVPNGTIMTVVGDYGSYLEATVDGGDTWVWNMLEGTYDEYAPQTRATDTPTLWRDMTPEEKGALLLAHHEGKQIELYNSKGLSTWIATPYTIDLWDDNCAYRRKPEPKVEVMTCYWGDWGYASRHEDGATHRITFSTIDGKPDPASIKMEEL